MTQRPGTPIAPPLRVWLVVEVLFGLAAISSITLDPTNTAERFAWHIRSDVMAAAIGGFYAATAPLLVLQVFARRWEMIRVAVPTAIAFTSAEMLATLIHLDTFSVGTYPFWIWTLSYALPPPIFVAAYITHQRRARRLEPPSGAPLPSALRTAILIVGGLLTADAVVGFIVPQWFTGSFPWPLTPLTARVLCGWLIAVGTLLLSIARENDRDRVRITSPMLIALLPVVGLSVARFTEQVDFGHPRLWIAIALFAFTAVVGAILARGSWRTTLR